MPKEINLLNKKNKILILFSYLGLILIFLLYTNLHIPCIFKKIFHIPCPSCGMTRSFISIINLNFKKAIYYNILSIPLFITLLIIFITIIIDLIYQKKYSNIIIKLITNNYTIIIILLTINWIINIIKEIYY